ncbi:hypothetical protein Lepto7376_3683 [[Leptolyngbya] sp. PCC 7376]|nr:hypothetical protein Lepto7376_3683 [[Leptolyngbya] sp. PCC 7376]
MKNCLKVDDCVAFLPRKQVADLLGISLPTLREYQKYLSQLSPNGWDYRSGDRGFTRQSFEVLSIFRGLVQSVGRPQAILNINNVMKGKPNG